MEVELVLWWHESVVLDGVRSGSARAVCRGAWWRRERCGQETELGVVHGSIGPSALVEGFVVVLACPRGRGVFKDENVRAVGGEGGVVAPTDY